MKMISRSNYEIYFVDFFDGRLNKKEQAELFTFLENNPDLKIEFDNYSSIESEPDLNIIFDKKDSLKKDSITEQNYKTWLVKDFENDLNDEQKKELNFFLSKNPLIKTEREIMSSIKLTADKNIYFKNKAFLKKGGKVFSFKPAMVRIISAAAVILIFLLVYFLVFQERATAPLLTNQNQKNELNRKDNPEVKISDNNVVLTKENDKQKLERDANNSNNTQKRLASVNQKRKIKSASSEPIEYHANNQTFALPSESSENGLTDPMETNTCESYVAPAVNITAVNTKSFQISNKADQQSLFKEIFNDEDLKDLGIYESKPSGEKTPAETLLNLAANELKQIAQSADIVFDKNKDDLSNSTTYALSVGQYFSVSRTVVR